MWKPAVSLEVELFEWIVFYFAVDYFCSKAAQTKYYVTDLAKLLLSTMTDKHSKSILSTGN